MLSPTERMRRKRLALAKERLGGKCSNCGSTEKLEFHHLNPETKTQNIPYMATFKLETFLKEVDKCQLLCKPCHCKIPRRTEPHGKGKAGKRGCYCDACLKLRNAYQREYYARKKEADSF